ncbi:MAG: hypothetical protein AB7J32_25725 [Pseudonocardia sp.]
MKPRRYEFRLDGRIPADELQALGAMEVEEVPPGLVLSGDVIDDAHLHGIIVHLRALGLRIVSVQPLGE